MQYEDPRQQMGQEEVVGDEDEAMLETVRNAMSQRGPGYEHQWEGETEPTQNDIAYVVENAQTHPECVDQFIERFGEEALPEEVTAMAEVPPEAGGMPNPT
jgi:hypothetical protein